MKTNNVITVCVLGLGLAGLAGAQAPAATAALYQTKCAACHGADGHAAGPAGKAMGARDFHLPVVQSQSDAELIAAITTGKGKMPAYGKQLSEADIKDLVAYVRQLGQKK